MKIATFNFYTYMFIAASLLCIALLKDIPFHFPLHHSLLFFFLALLGIAINFFSVAIEEKIAHIKYHNALVGLQCILLVLVGLYVLGSDQSFLTGILITLPAIGGWFIFEA